MTRRWGSSGSVEARGVPSPDSRTASPLSAGAPVCPNRTHHNSTRAETRTTHARIPAPAAFSGSGKGPGARSGLRVWPRLVVRAGAAPGSRHEAGRVSQQRAWPGAHRHKGTPGGPRATITHHYRRAAAAAAAKAPRAPARSASCPRRGRGAGGCRLGQGSGRRERVDASPRGLAVAPTAGRWPERPESRPGGPSSRPLRQSRPRRRARRQRSGRRLRRGRCLRGCGPAGGCGDSGPVRAGPRPLPSPSPGARGRGGAGRRTMSRGGNSALARGGRGSAAGSRLPAPRSRLPAPGSGLLAGCSGRRGGGI